MSKRLSSEELATMAHYDSHVNELLDPYGYINAIEHYAYAWYEDFWIKEAKRFLAELKEGRLLTLGCGTAPDAYIFREYGGLEYIGIDLSENLLKAARERETEVQDKPAVARMNMRHMAFDDSSFDGAWSFDSFSHIPERFVPDLLSELHRVLKPGGLAYINAWCQPARDLGQGEFVQAWEDPTRIEEFITAAGFELVDVRHDNGGQGLYESFLARSTKQS